MVKQHISYIRQLLLLLAVIVQASCLNDSHTDDDRTGKVNVGDAVPNFILTSADGETVSSSSLSGKAYILSFFDTGCPDCQKEFPVLQRIYETYQSVPMFNVPRSQSLDEVKQYWSKDGLTMPVYMPQDKDLYYRFATSGIPRIYIVDRQGIVQAVFTDSPLADYDTIDAILQKYQNNE